MLSTAKSVLHAARHPKPPRAIVATTSRRERYSDRYAYERVRNFLARRHKVAERGTRRSDEALVQMLQKQARRRL
jgi:hypothetical protein